jgi:hypothetical protein
MLSPSFAMPRHFRLSPDFVSFSSAGHFSQLWDSCRRIFAFQLMLMLNR